MHALILLFDYGITGRKQTETGQECLVRREKGGGVSTWQYKSDLLLLPVVDKLAGLPVNRPVAVPRIGFSVTRVLGASAIMVDSCIQAESLLFEDVHNRQKDNSSLHRLRADSSPGTPVKFDLKHGSSHLAVFDIWAQGICQNQAKAGWSIDNTQFIGVVEGDARPYTRRRRRLLVAKE